MIMFWWLFQLDCILSSFLLTDRKNLFNFECFPQKVFPEWFFPGSFFLESKYRNIRNWLTIYSNWFFFCSHTIIYSMLSMMMIWFSLVVVDHWKASDKNHFDYYWKYFHLKYVSGLLLSKWLIIWMMKIAMKWKALKKIEKKFRKNFRKHLRKKFF